jgi:hypothetical protein
MADTLQVKLFRDIPLDDPFFDSLKQDYKEFPQWFGAKASEPAYVQYTDNKLTGFMYLKVEEGSVTDVDPPLVPLRRIKIGTLKVDAHGTKLGERLIKKAFDFGIIRRAEEIYVTIFPKHKPLIQMLEGYGFIPVAIKKTVNGEETVLIKNLAHSNLTGDIRKDYPLIDTRKSECYLLGIKPEWHSQLFPDSLLKNESYDLLSDTSHTNSISKTYICAMRDVENLRKKDLLIIYRTKDSLGSAEYRSVATSVCVVEEIRNKNSFKNIGEYIKYTEPFSVFSEAELRYWWTRENMHVVKMLYNAAFTKRVIRKTLADKIGLDRTGYWGFMHLSKEQFLNIMDIGGVDARLIIR